MARKLTISVDQDVCVGNNMCVGIATKTFSLTQERQSQVENPEGDTEELILEAAENCPVSAITVVDAETGEQFFP